MHNEFFRTFAGDLNHATMTKAFVTVILVLVTLSCQAQTMKEIFSELPDSVLPTLTRNDRLDCIDFIENNLTNEVNNALDGKTRLTALTDNLAKVQVSKRTELQICKLPLDGGYVICLIHSSNIGAWDSTIRFYDSKWKLLDSNSLIRLPETKDFIVRADSLDDSEYVNIINKAGVPLVRADFEGTTLTLSYTSSNHADQDFQTQVLTYVKPEIRFKWDADKPGFTREQ